MPIIKEEQTIDIDVIGNNEYLDEEGTQALISALKEYAEQELVQ